MSELNPALLTHHRAKGDIRVPLAVTLKRPDGTVVNLTGLTVKFRMVTSGTPRTDKVALTASNVTVTDAANGKVQYDFQPGDVDSGGKYFAFFVIDDSGEIETFPPDGDKLMVVIDDLLS